MSQKLTMEAWIEANYSPTWRPSPITVRYWIKEGRIEPEPEKHGRRFMFDPKAKYVPKGSKIVRRLRGQASV